MAAPSICVSITSRTADEVRLCYALDADCSCAGNDAAVYRIPADALGRAIDVTLPVEKVSLRGLCEQCPSLSTHLGLGCAAGEVISTGTIAEGIPE